MSTGATPPEKLTTLRLMRKKRRGEKIACLTAYDYPSALLLDAAGVDLILVGDSAANVVYGHDNTLRIGMDEMLFHTRAVAAGVRRALVVADMPFLSFQVSIEHAVANAGLFLKAGAEAVKLEGAGPILPVIERLVELGIPVMGHLGLTPQSVHKLGGYRLQARRADERERLLADARALEQAGCFAVVLEKIPAEVAEVSLCFELGRATVVVNDDQLSLAIGKRGQNVRLAARLTVTLGVPTIGIGAGARCDGQVLVLHDMLGIPEPSGLRFVRAYAQLGAAIREAVARYCEDVRSGAFPADEHSFHIDEGR